MALTTAGKSTTTLQNNQKQPEGKEPGEIIKRHHPINLRRNDHITSRNN